MKNVFKLGINTSSSCLKTILLFLCFFTLSSYLLQRAHRSAVIISGFIYLKCLYTQESVSNLTNKE